MVQHVRLNNAHLHIPKLAGPSHPNSFVNGYTDRQVLPFLGSRKFPDVTLRFHHLENASHTDAHAHTAQALTVTPPT